MSKFTIYFQGGADVAVQVEADSLEEAEELAWDSVPSGVCAQCSGWGQEWSLDLGEFDLDQKAHSVDGEWVEVK